MTSICCRVNKHHKVNTDVVVQSIVYQSISRLFAYWVHKQ